MYQNNVFIKEPNEYIRDIEIVPNAIELSAKYLSAETNQPINPMPTNPQNYNPVIQDNTGTWIQEGSTVTPITNPQTGATEGYNVTPPPPPTPAFATAAAPETARGRCRRDTAGPAIFPPRPRTGSW